MTAINADDVPQRSEITGLIEDLREPLKAAKVRQISKGQAGPATITEPYQERILGEAPGGTVDRSWIFDYSAAEYTSWTGGTKPDDNPYSIPRPEQVYKVKWSTQTGCPVDEDCDERTAWGMGQQAGAEVDQLLISLEDQFCEYMDDEPFWKLNALEKRITDTKAAVTELVSSGESSWYEPIRALSSEGSPYWAGDDADEAHEQFGSVIRQAGQTQEAMAVTLQTSVEAEAASQGALAIGLQEALKNAHNTIYQKTYLDHYSSFPLLGTVSLIIGATTLPVSLGTSVAVVGFVAGAMNYFGNDVTIDTTVSRVLNQSDVDELVADLKQAGREIYEARTELRTEIEAGLETQFDPFFYSAATSALDLIPGQSFGEG